MPAPQNPFDLVKATDLSDRQIADYFVDFPAGASLLDRIKPTSAMPMFIFGGKGSGKTHLMRYLSHQLLKTRRRDQTLRAAIAADGYVGVYFKCGGLNAHRFAGKGQSDEMWQAVFAYYIELWLAQLMLAMLRDVLADAQDVPAALTRDLVRLFDVPPAMPIDSIAAFGGYLEDTQRTADVAINNSAITRQLDIQILATPGKLAFGLPQAVARHLGDLANVRFVYLVDEFENLTESQQRYVNTLVRERQDPCTLKIGVRLYGLRTKETLSAGEENREDSEYEALRLDAELRERPADAQYKFAEDLVRRRLHAASHPGPSGVKEGWTIADWFEADDSDPFMKTQFADLAKRYSERLPPYLTTLRSKLQDGLKTGVVPGVRSEADLSAILEKLRTPLYPFVERTAVFLLYRAWAHGKSLPQAASEIAETCAAWVDGRVPRQLEEMLAHFRADLVAQLLRDAKMKQRYAGFETFVKMSAGLPRGLLTILKYVFTWSQFFGETPFTEGRISVKAQVEGVAQAAEWFFTEARAPGPSGPRVRDAMTRLGELLRDVRFSDKPSECSLSTFSADVTGLSQQAAKTLADAESWSMLIKVTGGQHDRNLGRVDNKYQVHPMLAARWDLPVMRRGALALSTEEVEAVFAPPNRGAFEAVLKKRLGAMTAPFFGKPANGRGPLLPGIGDG
jgi:hypothetical protein